MGSILIAECKCGFKSGRLHQGTGMLCYEEVWIEPAVCMSCGILFLGNVKSKKYVRCPKCKMKATIYDNASSAAVSEDPQTYIPRQPDGEKSDEPDILFDCPKCKRKEMRFFDVGLWD